MEKHIALKFANTPGSVIRIALVLERRAYSIKSLHIEDSDDYSRMSITTYGEPEKFEQVIKQLAKLVDVISAKELVKETAEARSFEKAVPVAVSVR